MKLSIENLSSIKPADGLALPTPEMLALPEKVLQFGTGVLLRGLPDYFIDKANRAGVFNGRVVVVKSTSTGGTAEFTSQDNLYTICVRGINDGVIEKKHIVNAAISRVLTATEEWDAILSVAVDPNVRIVISNTTEVGITLVNEAVNKGVPKSFPGKLLACLYARYQVLGARTGSGMVIVPTELITGNGDKLKSIVLELAAFNQFEPAFIQWLESANHFCNTLVDRIVPGKLTATQYAEVTNELGYEDDLMIMAETYKLWAIESAAPEVKEILSFAQTDDGVVITPDITRFKELKLRLLNASHTFTCAIALLRGFTTVKEAMADESFFTFISELMKEEIVPSITSDHIDTAPATAFANSVLDRFRNPFLDHRWKDISVQYSSKLVMRCIALIQAYVERKGTLPVKMVDGLAAYLHLQQQLFGTADGFIYLGSPLTVNDQHADTLKSIIHGNENWLADLLRTKSIWETDLSAINGLEQQLQTTLTKYGQAEPATETA